MKIDFPEKTKKIIERLAESDKMPHSFLLWGSVGTGKLAGAEYFTRKIFGKTHDACIWERALSGNHPDIIVVKPELIEEKGKTREREIGIGEIRSAIDRLKFFPFELDKKICLIMRAQKMNLEAANALLKSLEEPRSATYFMLICDELEALPDTIISRSVPVRFMPVSRTEMNQWFEGSAGREDKRSEIAKWSGGRLGIAGKMIANPIMLAEKIEKERIFEKIMNANIPEMLNITEELGKNRPMALDALSDWELLVGIEMETALVSESTDEIRKFLGLSRALSEAKRLLEKTNANTRVVLEKMMLEIS